MELYGAGKKGRGFVPSQRRRMLELILSQALRKEHRAVGLSLSEASDHELLLINGTKTIAVFNATRATMEEIYKVADKYVARSESRA